MKTCGYCGVEIPETGEFCPVCGKKQPESSKIDGGTKGRSIASIVLGGEGLYGCFGMIIVLIMQWYGTLVFSLAGTTEGNVAFYLIIYLFVAFIAVLSLGFSLAAVLLSRKALQQNPDYNPAKIGKKISLAGMVISLAGLFLGMIPVLIGLL